jgi:hypothetical protein
VRNPDRSAHKYLYCRIHKKISGPIPAKPLNPENPGLFLLPSSSVTFLLMRHLLLLAAFSLLAVTSCKKYDDGYTQALVIYGGDLTVNGCGWLLRLTDGTLIKPVQLESAFQHDSLGVLVKYYNTGNQTNCVPQHPYDIVGIDEIKRDQ